MMTESYKALLNCVLVCLVSAHNNVTTEEIKHNLANLDRWQNEIEQTDNLSEEEKAFYGEKIKHIRHILQKELTEHECGVDTEH